VAQRAGWLAFSLDLGKGQEVKILSHVDPADHLRRRLSQALKNTFGRSIPFGFSIEIALKTGKPHLHGVIQHPGAGEDTRERLVEALRRAGGRIKGRVGSRQAKLTAITSGTGWARYGLKDFDEAARYLGTGKIIFLSTELTRLARELHAGNASKIQAGSQSLMTDYLFKSNAYVEMRLDKLPEMTQIPPINGLRTIMQSDDILPEIRFHDLARHIAGILQVRRASLFNEGFGTEKDLHDAIHVGLRAYGADLGDYAFNPEAGLIEPTRRADLVKALAGLDTSPFDGRFDPSDVVFVLAEVGDVLPASVQHAA